MNWLARLIGRTPDTCESCGGHFESSNEPGPNLTAVGRCASCGKHLCGRCVRTSHNGGALHHYCPMCGHPSGPDTAKPRRGAGAI
jgi:hypothetical protein